MRLAAMLIAGALFALAVSCGGGGGRTIIGDIIGGFPALLGTYGFTFDVTDDPNGVVGTVIDDVFVEHLVTESEEAEIEAYDERGRVWTGSFSNTEGAFVMSTDDEYEHKVVEFSVTGDWDANGGTGTFTMTFISGFGDDDGATVSGTWTALKI